MLGWLSSPRFCCFFSSPFRVKLLICASKIQIWNFFLAFLLANKYLSSLTTRHCESRQKMLAPEHDISSFSTVDRTKVSHHDRGLFLFFSIFFFARGCEGEEKPESVKKWGDSTKDLRRGRGRVMGRRRKISLELNTANKSMSWREAKEVYKYCAIMCMNILLPGAKRWTKNRKKAYSPSRGFLWVAGKGENLKFLMTWINCIHDKILNYFIEDSKAELPR